MQVEPADSKPLWAGLVAANFGLSAGPVAAVQSPNGELRYTVAPYLRAVAIVDGVRNVLSAQYTLDIGDGEIAPVIRIEQALATRINGERQGDTAGRIQRWKRGGHRV